MIVCAIIFIAIAVVIIIFVIKKTKKEKNKVEILTQEDKTDQKDSENPKHRPAIVPVIEPEP